MQRIGLKTISEDKYDGAGRSDITMIQEGFVNTAAVLGYVDMDVLWSKTGRMSEAEFDTLVKSMRENGYDKSKPVTIFVEKDRSISVMEGNHRIKAARCAEVGEVFVEIRYFGNSDDDTNLQYVLTGERRDMTCEYSDKKIQKLTKSLGRMLAIHDRMMKKINVADSFLDAETICEMNEAPMEASILLEELKGGE